MRWPVGVLTLVLLLASAAPARAQLFFAARPESGWRVGPLMLRASVGPEVGPARVSVLFSVVLPAGRSAQPQDLYLLWPGEVEREPRLGPPEPALARSVEALGFDVIGEGRLPLFAQSLASVPDRPSVQGVAGGAPFVTFVQTGGALGLSPPATWIRIPWTPRLVDRSWLMEVSLLSRALIKPRAATWVEEVVLGRRHVFSMSFNEVRDRPLFPMYFAHRDRVVRLADAPAEMAVNFADAGHLKIDEVYPLNSLRRLSETLESTQIVSLFLDTSEGIAPQQLTVHFGYFSPVQGTLVVVVPLVLLVLGYAAGPLVGRLVAEGVRHAAGRLHLGWARERQTGTVLGPDVIRRIVPGETTFDELVRLCGPELEVRERLGVPARRTVVYRGQRVRPQTRRLIGWLAAVRHVEVERQEVTVELDGDVVRDVQADVRRWRLKVGEPLA
jgi:hypothetical protein